MTAEGWMGSRRDLWPNNVSWPLLEPTGNQINTTNLKYTNYFVAWTLLMLIIRRL